MNITANRTELVEEAWSTVEKSVIVVILSIEMMLGILGNILVLIVKIVVRTIFSLLWNYVVFTVYCILCVLRKLWTFKYYITPRILIYFYRKKTNLYQQTFYTIGNKALSSIDLSTNQAHIIPHRSSLTWLMANTITGFICVSIFLMTVWSWLYLTLFLSITV